MTKSFADIKNLNPQKVGLGEIAALSTPTGSLAGKILRIPFYNGSTVEVLIVQWLDAPGLAPGSSAVLSYPTAFPNTMRAIVAVGGATVAGVPGINIQSIDRASCRVWNQSNSAATQLGSIIVIGS